jgi:hypothetical protein
LCTADEWLLSTSRFDTHDSILHHCCVSPGLSYSYCASRLQGLEAYGIFKLGEIIGRRNLVGYKIRD